MITETVITLYRVVNTAPNVRGPHGLNYMHDASRPWAVLRNRGRSEICVGRYSQEKLAYRYIRGKLAQNRLEQEAA